jgi:hypothetical protein
VRNMNIEQLARCMGIPEKDIPERIQQHAPWNGDAQCESTKAEIALIALFIRALGLDDGELIARCIETGEYKLYVPPKVDLRSAR